VVPAFPAARLIVIGDGPERPALEAQIARLGVGGVVELAGSVDDPVARLRDADLFVLPSGEEGMSVALLEAMALGIPVVATAIPGNQRLIEDNRFGRLVPPGDPAALARAIVGQWTDFDRAVQMGRAARGRVVQEFSISAVAQVHLALFQRLVREKRSRGE
jgi:glycosyltransferase involved in cell wall biosynthesis